MTTITNLVVALMIVTSGEEPVKAMPIQKTIENEWTVQTFGTSETLYRKTCKTNFVYSAKINTPICVMCPAPLCQSERKFTIEDLFGCQVQSFWVHCDANPYCEKHKSLKHVVPCYKNVKTGGAK